MFSISADDAISAPNALLLLLAVSSLSCGSAVAGRTDALEEPPPPREIPTALAGRVLPRRTGDFARGGALGTMSSDGAESAALKRVAESGDTRQHEPLGCSATSFLGGPILGRRWCAEGAVPGRRLGCASGCAATLIGSVDWTFGRLLVIALSRSSRSWRETGFIATKGVRAMGSIWPAANLPPGSFARGEPPEDTDVDESLTELMWLSERRQAGPGKQR